MSFSLVDAFLELSLSENNASIETKDAESIHNELIKTEKLKLVSLPAYEIPSVILDIEESDDPVQKTSSLPIFQGKYSDFRRNETKYIEAYKTMVYFEEAAQSNFVKQFNQENIQLKYTGEGRIFYIRIDELADEITEAIDEGHLEQFTLTPNRSRSHISIPGLILRRNKENIFVEIFEEKLDYFRGKYKSELYNIQFCVNRHPYQLQHNALKMILEQNLFNCLINNPKYDDDSDHVNFFSEGETFTFSGKLGLKLNEEQMTAVKNIIKGKNVPLPYLLFGPAGTGKTSTLVAAIEEIVRSSSKCVLVCANSNAACDEITDRLIDVLYNGEMFRMYAKSYKSEKIKDRIKPICNWSNGVYHFPSLSFLYQFRVLICTLATAGCLVRARNDPFFEYNHFSHVFIDECASTHEPTSLIPIAGVCSSYNQIESNIVLAGDPMQLDAVTKSLSAIKLGYKTSFMEQLFNRRLYKRNTATGEYNQKFITQLVKNYRSHSKILNVPNILFYENKLVAMASKDITDWYIGSNLLPSKSIPMIFKSVHGWCQNSDSNFSLFNIKEVNAVMDYIKLLLNKDKNNNGKSISQFDIGVVSPYKLQCKEISRACRQNDYNDITIGTAEIFQGQEKPVIIVSTVRTDGKIGFVNDPRRLNVVITRAKCLLIIIGDPHTLSLDANWKFLIEYFMQNNAFIQDEEHF